LILAVKGTGSRDRIQIFGQKKDNSRSKSDPVCWFLNLQDEPLMSRRLCHLRFDANYLAALFVFYWFIG